MIEIVRIALTRPLTFIVMGIVIVLAGGLQALRMPIDIFPFIGVPVVAAVWQYTGLAPKEMAGRILGPFERALTTTVNDIEHIESYSLSGVGVVKIYFHPGVNIATANAQVTAISQTMLRLLPAGATPPLVLNYNASTVPILQLAVSGTGLSEQKLFDLAMNQMRPPLVTVAGAALPFPWGGKQRQIQVDVDPQALQSKGLAPGDVADALAAQNQITPVGFAKIGGFQYNIALDNAPDTIEGLNDLPVKTIGGATIFLREVAHVRDGFAPQLNVVHVDGSRSVLMTVLKSGATSTLAIVQGVMDKLPEVMARLPASLKVAAIGDQSIFVRSAVEGVVREGVIAAALTSLMILLFLGSWRSTVIVAISIPLSIFFAIGLLGAAGHTLNIMTLGGLALAVGILVDEATVTIENINHHLERGKAPLDAIFDGSSEILVPAFVSLLAICIVFVPMFFLPGVSGYLFVPLALAVIFAMIGSFLLSRTLVPTLAMYLLRPHEGDDAARRLASANPLTRFQARFEAKFEALRRGYGALLERALAARARFVFGFLGCVVASLGLAPFLGGNFFPSVDAGQIAMHVRVPVGSRIEDAAAEFGRIEKQIRAIVPPAELTTVADNIGLPISGINLAYSNSGSIGPQDGDIMITLAPDHRPTAEYAKALREQLPRAFPDATFSFLPADITSQILNFGAPAPIDVQIVGNNLAANQALAQKMLRRMRAIPGVVDARIQQPVGYPELKVSVDRARLGGFGLTERDVTASLSTALAGTTQVAPAFFLNPDNGIAYPIAAQAPEYRVRTLDELANIPISGPGAARPQILGGVGTFRRDLTEAVVSHYNIAPLVDIYANVADRDLAAVGEEVKALIAEFQREAPKGVTITLRGQYQTMNTAFTGLFLGLLGAILMIYLLIVVNFQSWSDPFVIITALPGAFAGIVWMLFLTGTTLSVPALIGSIMCMGVATANSILVVSFARQSLAEQGDAMKAAIEAGLTRFRPVLMTALAMVIGMAPMALGLGDGGEQNAPLGRAVIGGLIVATFATLLFVPVVFSLVHGGGAAKARGFAKNAQGA
jgi:CzcA family heavy metal efflux pump